MYYEKLARDNSPGTGNVGKYELPEGVFRTREVRSLPSNKLCMDIFPRLMKR